MANEALKKKGKSLDKGKSEGKGSSKVSVKAWFVNFDLCRCVMGGRQRKRGVEEAKNRCLSLYSTNCYG